MKILGNQVLKNHTLKTFIILFALEFLLASCSPKESERKRSYPDNKVNQTQETIKSILNQSVSDPSTQTQSIQLEHLLQSIEPVVTHQASIEDNKNINTEILMNEVINPLKKMILNVNYLTIEKNRYAKTQSGRYIMPRMVNLFNDAILLVNKQKPSLIVNSDLMDKYKKILFWDCDKNLKGSCEFIKFFKYHDSVNMSQITKIMYKRETDDTEKIRIIKAGIEIKNRQLDSTLRFMLLERVATSLFQEDNGTISPLRKSQDSDLFANTLKISPKLVGSSKGNQKKYINLIKSLNPWKLSRNIDDTKNPSMTNIIDIAAKYLLYKKDGSLSDELKNDITSSIPYNVTKDYEQGFKFQEANIKGELKDEYKKYVESKDQSSHSPHQDKKVELSELQKKIFPQIDLHDGGIELYGPESKDILKTLIGENSFKKEDLDEYFYLIYQSFYGHFNLEDATSFWSHTKKDSMRLMVNIEKIIKYQIVNNIVLTNNRMNDFYNRNENMSIINILRESDKEASKIRKAWTKTIVRSKMIKSLLSRLIDTNKIDEKSKKLYNRINSIIEVIGKNIKFLVTYPNMFPLMHVMASLEMKDKIQTFFGAFTIDSNDIISIFFNGHMSPWFNFGHDGEKLDAREIIYTYYYALITQIFETYSTNTIATFTHEDFFRVVIKKLILSEEQSLEAKRTDLLKKLETFKNNAQWLRKICKEEEELQSQEANDLSNARTHLGSDFRWYQTMKYQKAMKPRRHIKNQLAFNDIDSSIIYEGINNKYNTIGQYIKNIYSNKILQTFNSMRKNFTQKKILASTILDVFKDFKGTNSSKIDEIFKEQFQSYYELKTDYIRIYTEAESKIRSCDSLLLSRARDIRHMLIYKEAEELGLLFDKIWSVLSKLTNAQRQSLSPESEEAIEIENIRREFNRYTQNHNHPDGLQPKFPDSYTHRFGYNQILISQSQVVSYKMDTAARIYAYLNELFPDEYVVTMPTNFKNESIYDESNPNIISFDLSANKNNARRAFITSGIQALANQMKWAEKAAPVTTTINKGDILISLFKMGLLEKDPSVNCHNKDLDSHIRSKNCMQITPKRIISHFNFIINYMNIDDRDRDILLLLGQEYKYGQKLYENLIKKENEHAIHSIYDLTFKRLFSDSGVTSSEDIWFSGPLVNYVTSVHKMSGSNFIFPVPDRINEIFMKKYSQLLKDYYQYNKDFLQEIKNQTNHAKLTTYSYRIDPISGTRRTHQLNTVTNKSSYNDRVSLEPLISDLIYSKFEGLSQKINNNTSGFFLDTINIYQDEISDIVVDSE